jgi:Fur family ferric uptake transcriptional regulator
MTTRNYIISDLPFSNPHVNQSDNLKSMGLKATGPRLKILELFQKAQDNPDGRHLTAEDVYRLLLGEHMDVGLATVYRVLTQFEQAGLLKRHFFESGKAVFELDGGHHHDHLVCLQCGHVEEFFDEEIEKRQARIAKQHGFVVRDHALMLYVDCLKPDCSHRKPR